MMPFIKIYQYSIPSYWLMCMLGLLASCILLYARRRRFNIAADDTLHIVLFGVIGAMIGAKTLYLITIAPELLRHASEIDWSYRTIELLFSGGYVFYGGLIGGFLAAAVYCCRYRISLRAAADFYAPALPLFHVFGRIGCFLAGCCWGIEAPWGVVYTHSLAAPNGVPLFPVQLAEAVCNLAICMVLLLRERRLSGRQPTGGALLLYAALYACVRFLLEFWRGDAVRGHFLFFSTSQWISVFFLFAIGIYFWKIARSRQL